MPIIEVKLFDYRLTEGVTEEIIAALTDGLCQACGEEVRERTEVIVQGNLAAVLGIWRQDRCPSRRRIHEPPPAPAVQRLQRRPPADVSIVGGEGIHFVLDDGRRVIDGSDTGAALGHAHPDIVAAIRAAADAPIVNDGWYYRDRDEAVNELAAVAFSADPDIVGAVRFFLSGSEANDAILSLAQALTGRAPLATRERAYHGGIGLAREMTVQPHWHGGLTRRRRRRPRSSPPDAGHALPVAVGARVGGREGVMPSREDLAEPLSQCAAVILDYSQGGVYHSPPYQDLVADTARECGTIWVADEVVTGMGRTGGWFAFQQGELRPDAVTLGKPLAAGAMPAAAVVFSRDARAHGGSSWQSYSTFRAHPLMMPGIRAHLRILQRDRLPQRARELDAFLERRLTAVAARHPSVARIDGRGCTGRSSWSDPTGVTGAARSRSRSPAASPRGRSRQGR